MARRDQEQLAKINNVKMCMFRQLSINDSNSYSVKIPHEFRYWGYAQKLIVLKICSLFLKFRSVNFGFPAA